GWGVICPQVVDITGSRSSREAQRYAAPRCRAGAWGEFRTVMFASLRASQVPPRRALRVRLSPAHSRIGGTEAHHQMFTAACTAAVVGAPETAGTPTSVPRGWRAHHR